MKLPQLLLTPTFAATTGGVLISLALWRGVPYADMAAFALFGLAGMGTAIAIHAEVQRQGYRWGWGGIVKALRRPSARFWRDFLGHVGQLVVAVAIALRWRRRRG